MSALDAARERFQVGLLERTRLEVDIHLDDLIRAVAGTIICGLHRPDPPIDVYEVAKVLGIEIIHDTKDRPALDGTLTPFRDRLRLTLSSGRGDVRARFTIAHECGHSLFYGRAERSWQRIDPSASSSGLGRRGHRREEGLCDAFAGALLLPERWLHGKLSALEPSYGAVLTVARVARVSPEVVIRRALYDLQAWPTAAFYGIRLDTDSGTCVGVKCFRGKSVRRDRRVVAATRLQGELATQVRSRLGEMGATVRGVARIRSDREWAWVTAE